MSHCPTCGHRADDELVHSTAMPEPRRPSGPRFSEEWRDTFLELAAVLRSAIDDDAHQRRVNSHLTIAKEAA